MIKKKNEIFEELKSVFKSKTLDAIIPPTVFLIVYNLWGIVVAIGVAILIALLMGIYRIRHKQSFFYAFGGVLGILAAAGVAYLSNNANNYFLGGIISSGGLFLLSLISLVFKRPLAAWTSHLSRGWSLPWYFRKDVRPAYTEVTILWTVFFLSRVLLQYFLLKKGQIGALVWVKTLLGWPITLVVLVLSYLYGKHRLQTLKGPSIDEFDANEKSPWKGQTRGF